MATPRRSIKKMYQPDNPKVAPGSPLQRNKPKQSSSRREADEYSSDSGQDETDRAFNSSSDYERGLLPDKKLRSNVYYGSDAILTQRTNSELQKHHRRKSDEGISLHSSPSKHKEPKNNLYPNLREFKTENQKASSKSGPSPTIIRVMAILILISLLFLGYMVWRAYNGSYEEIVLEKTLPMIRASVKRDLKVLFQDIKQSRTFWVQVVSQVDDLFEDDVRQPSVILMVVPTDAQKTAACIVHRLQEVVSLAFEDSKMILFDVESISYQDVGTIKHELDLSLSQLSAQHTAVIHNLEKLPAEAAMILHAYCDNENAPHKRALIILTLMVQSSYSSLNSEDIANVDRMLEKLWNNKLRDVDIGALISRIANAPVIVKPEDSKVIELLCPYK